MGFPLESDGQIMPDLLKSALNYGKKYVNKTIEELLREWALTDLVEDDFPFNNR
jgi:hypothetical protein